MPERRYDDKCFYCIFSVEILGSARWIMDLERQLRFMWMDCDY